MKYFFIIIIIFLLLLLVYQSYTENFSTESINNIISIYGDNNKKFVANNVDVSNNATINTINISNSLNFPNTSNTKYTYKINNSKSGFVISLYENNNLIKTYLTLDYSGNVIFNNDLNNNSNLTANNLNVDNTLISNNDLIVNGKIKSDINGTKYGWKIWKQVAGLLDPVNSWPAIPNMYATGFNTDEWVVICVGNQFLITNASGMYTYKYGNKWYCGGFGYIGTFIAIPKKTFFDSDLIAI